MAQTRWLNRQEFVVVGWSDSEGMRPHLGALLLGYYIDDGKLIYAGRVGTGMPHDTPDDYRKPKTRQSHGRASGLLSASPSSAATSANRSHFLSDRYTRM